MAQRQIKLDTDSQNEKMTKKDNAMMEIVYRLNPGQKTEMK